MAPGANSRTQGRRGPSRVDLYLRKLVPAVPVLSRKPMMRVLDWIDRLIGLPFKEARNLPPNRFRIRVGVGNRLLFNQFAYKYQAVNFWLRVFDCQMASMTSNIVDIGCGCGRYAMTISGYEAWDRRFRGHYTGIDADKEMIEWCRKFFPPDRFSFHHADVYSKVYNPSGALQGRQYQLPLEDDSQDFVFSNSLFTHVLEDDLHHYVRETFRVLASGGWMQATVFCVEAMEPTLGGRWTFLQEQGHAMVESREYPEAAVAYREAFLVNVCKIAGFRRVNVVPGLEQSLVQCQK